MVVFHANSRPPGEGRVGIGAFIFYESAFPDLVRRFVRAGAETLVNLSNDGYFGHSAAHEQHLLIVRMRAVENRRWILRSACEAGAPFSEARRETQSSASANSNRNESAKANRPEEADDMLHMSLAPPQLAH